MNGLDGLVSAVALLLPLVSVAFAFGVAAGLLTRWLVLAVVLGVAAAVGLCWLQPFLFQVVLKLGNGIEGDFKRQVWDGLRLFALPAIVGSLVGCRLQRRVNGRLSKRLAAAAGILVLATGLLCLVLPSYSGARRKASHANCSSNLRQIGLSLAMYADQYGGRLPPDDGANGLGLLTNVMSARNIFHCPHDTNRPPLARGEPFAESRVSYVYRGGLTWGATKGPLRPICWDKPGNHGDQGLNVLFTDGSVVSLTFDEWRARRSQD